MAGSRSASKARTTRSCSHVEPLFVVDGTPLPQGSGGIVFLNPYDITKIEVLRNPADISLYGVRAGNGVIRITTTLPVRR